MQQSRSRLPVAALVAAHPVPVLRHGGAARVLGGDGDPLVGVHLVHLSLAHCAVVGHDVQGVLIGHGHCQLVGAAHQVVIKARLLAQVDYINLLRQKFSTANLNQVLKHVHHSWRGPPCK